MTSRSRFQGKGPIARKVISALRKVSGSKVVNLAAYKAGRMNAEALQETIASKQELAALDPAFAVYVHVQNVVATLSDQLAALEELRKLRDVIEAAEEEYMPSAPPMSPITNSYFSSWCLFDLAIGQRKETLGTIILELARELGMDPEFRRVVKLMQNSRMGVYVHEGVAGNETLLREFVTNEQINCIVPSGYRGYDGERGEIWLVRVLPPPHPTFDYSVVFTTPYVEMRFSEAQWQAYFERTLGACLNKAASYELLMKYGPQRHYWTEYLFEAYLNHVKEAVFLAGLPDVAATRPHSPEYAGEYAHHDL